MDQDGPDVVLLRGILARELETINNYHSLLARASTPEVAEFIAHIIDEEKEHVAEAMELINRIDPGQAARFGAGAHYMKTAPVAPRPAPHSGQSTSADEVRRFTIGSLREGPPE